jgi:hypothetical protein
LCKLANDIINNDLKQFGTRRIVTTQLLNEHLLRYQINDTVNQLIHSMQTEFERVNYIFLNYFHKLINILQKHFVIEILYRYMRPVKNIIR